LNHYYNSATYFLYQSRLLTCPTDWAFPTLNFATCFNHFYFFVPMKHCSFLWRLRLQLNEKPLDILPSMAWSFFSTADKLSASKSNFAVWVGTQKHLRNAAACGLKEWGLDSPPVYAWYYYKQKIGISCLSVNQCMLDWCYRQFHLLTVSNPNFDILQSKPPQ